MREEGKREQRGERAKREDQESRDHKADMAGLYRSEKLGEGKSVNWRSLG